jgi:acyl-ACP--UDP-N-acetylglucosamine O-acyltransferase
VEVYAQGDAIAEGLSRDVMFTARGHQIVYITAKDLVSLEGDGQNNATLYRQSKGQPALKSSFKKMRFWPKTNQISVDGGTEFGGGVTEIGESNFLMAYTHVAHDCKTGKGVVLANNATLAGHITIGDYVIIGGLVAIHQFVRIGDFAYIGGKSAVVKDIPPYIIAAGDRATLHGLNKVGLQRHGLSQNTLMQLKKAYRVLFRIGLTVNEGVDRVLAEVENIPEVLNLVNFIKTTQRGITR